MLNIDPHVDFSDGEQEEESSRLFKTKVQPQLTEAQEAAIQVAETAAGGFLKVFLGTNFFVSIFLIGVLQYLWGLINTLQMIVLTVLLNVIMPQNSSRIMIAIMKLTNLDVIETESFLNGIFTFKSEFEPRNENFEDSGYESSNFIIELGPIFIILVVATLILGCRSCLEFSTRKCPDNTFTRCVKFKTSAKVIVVRFLIESCIELGLVALIAVIMVSSPLSSLNTFTKLL